ncbi:hypothetical protein [Pseudomonas sp.]|uniref:hypothetical protein n=1 Tax=Pseudomonas sp. TaxID=306 RepID=UPI003F3F8AC3
MSGPVVVSGRTAAQLEEVARFFGIDMEWNRHIFRHAAQIDSRAFEVAIGALAQAIEQDSRRGITGRIRESIAREKAKK